MRFGETCRSKLRGAAIMKITAQDSKILNMAVDFEELQTVTEGELRQVAIYSIMFRAV